MVAFVFFEEILLHNSTRLSENFVDSLLRISNTFLSSLEIENQLFSRYISYSAENQLFSLSKLDNFFYSRKPASTRSMQRYREKSRAFGTRDPPLLHARLTLLNTRNEELARRLYARTHSFLPIRQMTKSPGKIM